MSHERTLRELVDGELDPALLSRRKSEGWRLAAVEWERADALPAPGMYDVPFGFRVAADCAHLEEHPGESEVLRTVMRLIVQEAGLAAIAMELNRGGFTTRSGQAWTETQVFRLMPSLVASGPRIFRDQRWPTFKSLAEKQAGLI